MSEENFNVKSVIIWGLGRYEHGSGLAAVKFFMREKVSRLFISDLKTKDDLMEQVERVDNYAKEVGYAGKIDWSGMGRELVTADLKGFDVLVPNPAVPVSKAQELVKGQDIQIESEMTLFFARCPREKIVGVTGTRGKSTTTALIHHILKESGKKVMLGGNIAKGSPLDILDEVGELDYVILELSNFMLEYLDLKKQSPHIAVLLNVLEDHLSRYGGDIDAYADVKAVITEYQSKDDILICNSDNEYSKKIGEDTAAKVIWFMWGDEWPTAESTGLWGVHNDNNVKAAVECALQLGINKAKIEEALPFFAPLEGRLQKIAQVSSVDFYNDTTSTTPVACKAALRTFMNIPSSVVLIAGGADKGLSFDELAEELRHNPIKAIVWLYNNDELSGGTVRFKKALEKELSNTGIGIDQIEVNNMIDAVKKAFELAKPRGNVLLSPACSSFDLFKNEFDRGDQFNDAVKKLQTK